MVARRITTKTSRPGHGGSRPGSGRPPGAVNEFKRVARAVAGRTGELPHELLLRWARTGKMDYPGTKKVTTLEPSDRIACAKGCAAWYKPAMQPRQAPGEQPPVMRLELDEKMIAALAAKSPQKLDVLRDVLRALSATGGAQGDLAQLVAQLGQVGPKSADASRYGRMLSESSETQGSA